MNRLIRYAILSIALVTALIAPAEYAYAPTLPVYSFWALVQDNLPEKTCRILEGRWNAENDFGLCLQGVR